MKTIEIFESYVGKGAPSNASGKRRGYGLTRQQAIDSADHFANQAAFVRVRKVTVSDQEKPSSMTSRAEKIAWDVCGIPGDYAPPTPREKAASDLISKGRFASAISKCLSEK